MVRSLKFISKWDGNQLQHFEWRRDMICIWKQSLWLLCARRWEAGKWTGRETMGKPLQRLQGIMLGSSWWDLPKPPAKAGQGLQLLSSWVSIRLLPHELLTCEVTSFFTPHCWEPTSLRWSSVCKAVIAVKYRGHIPTYFTLGAFLMETTPLQIQSTSVLLSDVPPRSQCGSTLCRLWKMIDQFSGPSSYPCLWATGNPTLVKSCFTIFWCYCFHESTETETQAGLLKIIIINPDPFTLELT